MADGNAVIIRQRLKVFYESDKGKAEMGNR
jgi:hypothetical protein